MATVMRTFLGCALAALLPMTVSAQDESAAMDDAVDQLDQMAVAVSRFVGDVRFDESDVRSLLDHWDEFSEFEDHDDEEDTLDFDAILADSEYRRWAASHNLDANDWMRKTVRITMTMYREHMLAAAEMMPEQMAQQLEMIEQQREELGEEMYQEIRQGIQATAAYGEALLESSRRLPEPTTAESAILEQYRAELMAIMESGDDDDEYGEYEEYEEYDDYEDDEGF